MNKYTILGEVLTEIGSATEKDVNEVVKIAKDGQKQWAKFGWQERGNVLRKAADIIRVNADFLADWEVRDNGKPISEAISDVLSCADTFDFFSGKVTVK